MSFQPSFCDPQIVGASNFMIQIPFEVGVLGQGMKGSMRIQADKQTKNTVVTCNLLNFSQLF